jgi:glycosyltransferase involved in cell wall biosynthesis
MTKTILVVGQIPPPLGGQAIMIERLLAGNYGAVSLKHVPMHFSTGMKDIGTASFQKLIELARLIYRINRGRKESGATILYFPPAPPNWTPVIRDIVLLSATRWRFKKLIFHLHAAGLGEFRSRLRAPLRWLFDLAYQRPDIAIATSESGRQDADAISARQCWVVPNGMPDVRLSTPARQPERSGVVRILFVGLLCEGKGVLVLLEALALLQDRGHAFVAQLIGAYQSRAFEDAVHGYVEQHALADRITFCGEKQGDDLLGAYADAQIFCFPSFFSAESFGLVCVEAMRVGIPVVATNWRGIPEVVEHDRTGFIVPPRSANALAEALQILILKPELREKFGRAGRDKFLARYTLEMFHSRMREVFQHVADEE